MEIHVNKEFKDALITGILSSPIIYVPHFHYNYVDQALSDIIDSGILGLRLEQIFELSNCDGPVHFERKYQRDDMQFEFVELLLKLVGSDNSPADDKGNKVIQCGKYKYQVEKEDIFTQERVFLVKNVAELLTDPKVQYWLQIFASKYEKGDYDHEMTLILVSPQPVSSLPSEIEKYVTVLDIPAPTEQEIEELIENELPVSKQFKQQEKRLRTELARTLMGLQLYEIEQVIRSIQARSMGKRLTRYAKDYALEEKKSIVKKSGIIEVVDSDVSFNQVGGLEVLREDLKQKSRMFNHLNDIQELKFPMPKGILILGMPGCGKSLIAKSVAKLFDVSLLRLDVNRLMGKYVGQSEENLRKALMTAEAAHPCVLWIDEIEKAFAGVNSSNSSNDIIMRLMGHFLTWMQERKTAVYIVATANDALRPELMRKGRFDEVYFVDFPNESERADILDKKINNYKGADKKSQLFDFSEINDASIKRIAKQMTGDKNGKGDGFSGAEIEAVVNSVMEKKIVHYFDKKDKNEEDGKDNGDEIPKVPIEEKDFVEVINNMRPSVMCNQKGMKDENGKELKTPIERIKELQEVYKFKKATKKENK
ncbi:MAG: AAA family ATPase [Bacteroidales bacterium]|nr:AAA family ATPase [Bacteroidales bacterium]